MVLTGDGTDNAMMVINDKERVMRFGSEVRWVFLRFCLNELTTVRYKSTIQCEREGGM